MKIILQVSLLSLFFCCLAAICGCGGIKSEKEISLKERKYLGQLGLLDGDEKIILFDSQGGFIKPWKQSGNFFTDKRIASYWIDERHKSRSHKHSAFFGEIDTIWRFPKYHSLTLASYFNTALLQWSQVVNKK